MTWQLIIHSDEEICDVVSMAALKALRQISMPASIEAAQNIRAAQKLLDANPNRQPGLVVISSTMPRDDTESVGSSVGEPTNGFIKKLKSGSQRSIPVIVIADSPDDRLAGFLSAFDHTSLVTVGTGLISDLTEQILSLCRIAPPPPPGAPRRPARDKTVDKKACVQLDIHLGGDQFGVWQMERKGHVRCEASGMLQIDHELLAKVIRHSKKLNQLVAGRDCTEWLADLDELSSDLRLLLFRNASKNIDCWDRFLTQREQVGGVSRSRIRVTVNDETHAMLVEALRDSGQSSAESWVLNAPVFRRYAARMAYPPLFTDEASREGPISCLIIEADEAPGTVEMGNGEIESFLRLGCLEQEASEVEKIMRGAGSVVERLRMADTDGRLTDTVLAKLGERQWHVVHFCGHVVGGKSEPALVLRAASDGLLAIKRLSKSLERTQLLFLNSCRSADTRVVMHAVEQSVSAVLGFQWVIEDQAAFEFATDFYRLLFGQRREPHSRLEDALMQARKNAYKRQPEHPSWMAPVLVMQMN
jgi:CHAT domain